MNHVVLPHRAVASNREFCFAMKSLYDYPACTSIAYFHGYVVLDIGR